MLIEDEAIFATFGFDVDSDDLIAIGAYATAEEACTAALREPDPSWVIPIRLPLRKKSPPASGEFQRLHLAMIETASNCAA